MRERIKTKRRIVVKVGSSTLTHMETGKLNLGKMEKLVRILVDIHNEGKEVILVSSGAIPQGRAALGLTERPQQISLKQACAAVGQARLMMVYEKLFGEYNQISAQVLITKDTMMQEISRINAQNTFRELLSLGVIPIVNENDTVATEELNYGDFGDNDTLSAIVAALVGADLLILLSDIDGLYTDDPRSHPDATFIEQVDTLDDTLFSMAIGAGSSYGTGGMSTKLSAARLATESGADMVIANGEEVEVVREILAGKPRGTLFLAHENSRFDLMDYIDRAHQ